MGGKKMIGMLTFFDCNEAESWLANQERGWNDWRPKDFEYQGWRPRPGADIFNAIQINEPFRATTTTGIVEGSSGDYLVKGASDVLYVVTKEVFETDFCLL
jgi:hypothetical protein